MKGQQRWLKNHKYSDRKISENIQNLLFAREFFKIIDVNGSGLLGFEELLVPLISFGLSSDSKFVKQVLKVINPEKFKSD